MMQFQILTAAASGANRRRGRASGDHGASQDAPQLPGTPAGQIVIRRCTRADRAAVLELAALNDRHPPQGESLLAFVGDELRAAISLQSGATVADPFRSTEDVVELLRLRALQEVAEA
jgi:hypothetical protein